MRELLGLAKGLATSWRGDAALATVVVAWALVWLAASAARGDQHWVALVVVLPYAAALAIRRRWPVLAAVVASAAVLLVRPLGQADLVGGNPFIFTPFLLGYALGAGSGLATGLAGTVLLAASLQIATGPFSPVVEMITVGPWLAGRIWQSRRKLTDQLQARNAELAGEQERFALESVRYERARIARELHDIVAHCLSAMVVQASAGQRVDDADSDAMAGALTSVAEAAAQAQEEVGRLVELLADEHVPGTSPNLQMVDELVRRAAVTGLQVSCRFVGASDRLAPVVSEAAYRVVQEALTNALKHAPAAPVTVTVRARGRDVEVSVVNSVGPGQLSELEHSGGQFGLAAMRERVTACGGSLSAGPTPEGGWQVAALLPACSY
jgi:signal transduction histidine kinase